MANTLPFTIQRIERVWVCGIGIWITGIVCFVTESNLFLIWTSYLSVIEPVSFFEPVSFWLLFYFKTFSNFWVSGAAPVRAKPHEPCIYIYVYVRTKYQPVYNEISTTSFLLRTKYQPPHFFFRKNIVLHRGGEKKFWLIQNL